MLLKLLKLKAKDAISKGATTTSRSGSVTRRKTCQRPPPSTRAASVSSLGIDWSAPIETRKKYGKVSHVLTRMIDVRAHQALPKSHGTCTWRMWLTTPKSSFSRPAQTSSASPPGIAYGTTRIDL